MLYICPTPIGNLDDMPNRVIEILKAVDLIAAEDTRHTLKLLNYFDIKKPLISYHEHNKTKQTPNLIDKMLNGSHIALVADAGTPAISDPGEEIVRTCIENNIKVIGIPGPTALITALTVSGLHTGRFAFEGFLSVNKKNRRLHLEEIKKLPHTLIFYEAPHKLMNTLKDLYEHFGNRRISICRELTKKYEEIIYTNLETAQNMETKPRGEYVLIVEGYNLSDLEKKDVMPAETEIMEYINVYIKNGMNTKEAIKETALRLQIPKRIVYNEYERKKQDL